MCYIMTRRAGPACVGAVPTVIESEADEWTRTLRSTNCGNWWPGLSASQWEPFHTPKNLSMALAIEAAELMEHFQWLTPDESAALAAQPDKLAEVADELADVTCYALALCNALAIDLAGAVQQDGQERREIPGCPVPRPLGPRPHARGPGRQGRPPGCQAGRRLPRPAVTPEGCYLVRLATGSGATAAASAIRSSPCRLRIA